MLLLMQCLKTQRGFLSWSTVQSFRLRIVAALQPTAILLSANHFSSYPVYKGIARLGI